MLLPAPALSRLAARWLGEAAVALFPSRCFGCEKPLPRVQLLGACPDCWCDLARGRTERCRRCALPLPGGGGPEGPAAGCCLRCAVRPPPFSRAVASVTYDHLARRFLLRGKEGLRPELFRQLGDQLASAVSISGMADGVSGIVAVPSSSLAWWRRGFDPAALLARQLASVVGAPVWDGVLRRRRLAGPSAKALSARARWAWAQGEFTARKRLPDTAVLLVDDVLTTGATASACATALRDAGAREVRVAVWARTPSPGRGL